MTETQSPPNYTKAKAQILEYRDTTELSADQTAALSEIIRRLERLESRFAELMAINSKLSALKLPEFKFDPETDTLSLSIGGKEAGKLQLNRADPNTPIRLENTAAVHAYVPEGDTSDSDEDEAMKGLMEDLLEHYYSSAFRVVRIVKTLPGLKKFRCMEITIVRNKLLEHVEQGELYSFGFGTEGPRVKPMARGRPDWVDHGLIGNTRAFDEALADAFRRATDSSASEPV